MSAFHIRQMDLTPPQFDVVATLGNTPGMSCKELSEKTLITKGTLTGVIDRLIEKGVVSRCAQEQDRRSVMVALTPQGEALFQQVFPAHIAYMKTAFDLLEPADMEELCRRLSQLRTAFNQVLEQKKHEIE
ncbi:MULTISPECIES: MarR family winged helix-turn-helix transcriptional regulator [Aquitalea]|uniref:MarR family winged helix-turn-helix transcriptional regulator n=1 Tax=Aquitalea TaxID=407217 RepID=UPI001E649686|nr:MULTISPECIES: MarR family transcriptional regulator [Aquitalea]